MKVYVITGDAVYDFEDCGVRTSVYATKEKAQEAFRKIVEKERQFSKDEEFIIEESEDFFESYADGEWARCHSRQMLREIEVEE